MFRTLFGNICIESPRLRHCRWRPHEDATFSPVAALVSERVSPELLYMETRWPSLASYGMTVKALQDFLPVNEKLNAATVPDHPPDRQALREGTQRGALLFHRRRGSDHRRDRWRVPP
ncbi:MAG TPA: hypothetical protein VMK12_23945 [Anaeromyxobacteraceae bacterium]|nr:hypothetical protein [Anaeromyxobacteraceae bacterium]